jgi:carbon storage regulator
VLVLTRKANETVVIGNDITVTVTAIEGEQVRLGIQAPRHIPVHRLEVYEAIEQANLRAARSQPEHVDQLLRSMTAARPPSMGHPRQLAFLKEGPNTPRASLP